MAVTSYPFDGQTVTETQFSQLFRELQETGVAGSEGGTDLKVTAAGAAMQVSVAAGFAIVRGHAIKNDSAATVNIAAAESQARTDIIVAKLDPAANSVVLAVVKGTAGGGLPSLTQTDTGVYEMPLAHIAVGASVSVIAADKVTDVRPFVPPGTGVWSTATRPASPRRGKLGYNTSDSKWEWFNGTVWVDLAPTTDWTAVQNKPATFAPSAHTHDWAAITGKPATFTPSTHGHDITQIGNTHLYYAALNHSHAYSASNHLHDTRYTLQGHTHSAYLESGDTIKYANGSERVRDNSVSGSGSYYAVWVNGADQFCKNTSSRRYKENIRDHTFDPAAVLNLRPVVYDRIDGNANELGLIAEEVAEHLPELVIHDDEGRIDAIRYDLLAVAMVSTLRTQEARIATLEAAVAALMAK